ncbi:YqgE/AlgH family protein [Psychrobium sp. 1_MG-2023]|uniref:YqgE/AlgH family protein n=1 Tax=Psychrobium sp. 1_MG-2023 TaxID=3062624 RepID=UPI000C34D90E|nr:YqgE/AlgH family protein [Psychrobium sp. 1_MG-2023]MDP2562376.1 YqgE/AlgH family protein [Psychrobium sp. 1_MG-2023]PKF55858.1 YqgE/AlgH family protein [Alteromonadales bacterium alter-6D02]
MGSLQNHLLIAMPNLDDPYFQRSVIYLCEHDEDGAMGLIVNQPISQLSVSQLLDKLEYPNETDPQTTLNKQVFNGGPVEQERGFVLHSPQLPWNSSQKISEQIMLTTSKDILEVIGTTSAPDDFIITLGYASWTKGQLEQELADNTWLTIQADADVIFKTPVEQRWEKATKKLGFDVWQLTSQSGHC